MSDWSISDGSDSDGPRSIVRRKGPDLPESPFKQFCQHVAANEIIDPSDDPDILSPTHLQKRWDGLSKEETEHWEAQFGRRMMEYLKDHDIPGSSARANRARPPISTERTNQHSLVSRAPVHSSQDGAPWILHRAELYLLHNQTRYGRETHTLGASYVTSVEHHDIMDMNINSRNEDLETASSAVFEVVTFLAQMQRTVRDNNAWASYNISEPIPYQPGRPINARAEAGEVITVKSKTIIKAVQSIAPDYPEFSFQGDNLVVAEPFCVFLRYRNEFLAFRDALSAKQSRSTMRGPDNDSSPLVSREPDSGGNLDGVAVAEEHKEQQDSHITMLYDFVDSRYLDALEREKARWRMPEATCTFEWTWLLFTPGTLVYEHTSDKSSLPRAYLVESFALGGLFHYDARNEKPKVNPLWLDSRQLRSYQHRLSKVKVTLVYLTNDGRQWIPKRKYVVLMPFAGERPITDLNIYPCEYSDDPKGQIKQRLIARGKRYHTLSTRGLYQYHGQTLSGTRRWLDGRIMVDSDTYHHDLRLTTRSDALENHGLNRQPIRVYSDTSSSSSGESDMKPSKRLMQRRQKVRRRRRRRTSITHGDEDNPANLPFDKTEAAGEVVNPFATELDRITASSKQAMRQYLHDTGLNGDIDADKVYMICDRRMYAYVLDEREWVLLAVEGISDCQFNTEMIHDLQVDKNIKRMIQALAHSYTVQQPEYSDSAETKRSITKSSAPWSSDFVPNKGRGQILLLHGKPGVGKTTAAECVAERTKRPLLSITCGDLGSDSSVVWGELTRWLRLGALWNAVLLFDEADVFLEARTQGGDINRNSLVSIFLRALEYYQGLIFLTTNRVGTFDEAVVSRIHVILHFPELTNDDRQRIWDTSFKRLKEERSDIAVDDAVRDHALRDPLIQSLCWNGREIRSAFNNMISLAEWDARETGRLSKNGKVEIRREHLQEVATTSSSFKEYLRSLYGFSEASRMKLHGLRDDEFDLATSGNR